ncbi:MAG: hypothetical protein M1814_002451 [Vezdaea aestivalis]|nr:MAG: hypothetical protein M1814_002451 [Vezdaea aestivalis]
MPPRKPKSLTPEFPQRDLGAALGNTLLERTERAQPHVVRSVVVDPEDAVEFAYREEGLEGVFGKAGDGGGEGVESAGLHHERPAAAWSAGALGEEVEG